MARVKRGTVKIKKRRAILKLAKGYKFRGKSTERAARERLLHAFVHAYQGRKQKKRDYRSMWQVNLNAALREHGTKYSVFTHALKQSKVNLNRKMLAELAADHPQVFEKILAEVK